MYMVHYGIPFIELGKVEDEIFKNRRQNEKEFRRRQKQKKRRTMVYTPKLKAQAVLQH